MTDGFAALLMLTDGRFPTGGHTHSGGLEPLAAAGRVRDIASLEAFLRGRVTTTGSVAAAFAVASHAAISDVDTAKLTELDSELDARMPSPALCAASRKLGRQLLRAARAAWPDPRLDDVGRAPHQAIALGAAAAAAGLDARATAAAALHEAVTGPATAAIRLLGLDPYAVHAVLARLGGLLDDLATAAAGRGRTPAGELPADGSPLLDIAAQHHATWEVRLFAS